MVSAAYLLVLLSALPFLGEKTADPFAGYCSRIEERIHETARSDEPSRHVKWGVPLEDGPLQALFVVPHGGVDDAAELACRLEMEVHVAPVWAPQQLGGDPKAGEAVAEAFTPEAVLARLEEQLERPWDVAVIGNVDLGILPENLLARLLEHVRAGKGLVVSAFENDVPPWFREQVERFDAVESEETGITRGIGEELTSEWPTSLDFVHPRIAGNGRVVMLDFLGSRPYTHALLPALIEPARARETYFDTYLSLAARAVRWAAGRAPEVRVEDIVYCPPEGPDEAEIPPGLPEDYIQSMRDASLGQAYHTFQVTLAEPAARSYEVVAQMRQPERERQVLYPDLPSWPKGEASYVLELPVGPGHYFADFWLLRRGKVVEWFTSAVDVPGWPEIKELTFSKGLLLPNDALDVALTVRPLYARPRPCTVYARGTDAYGRVVSEAVQTLDIEGGRVELTLGFADLIAPWVNVEIFCVDSPSRRPSEWELSRAAYENLYLPVCTPTRLDTYRLVAQTPIVAEYNARSALERLQERGVDTISAPATDAARFFLARQGFGAIPDVTNLDKEEVKSAVSACWTTGTQCYIARGQTEGGPEAESFKAFLRARYPSLKDLNTAWGTGYATWGEAGIPSREAVAASGRYTPWLDWREHEDTAFCASQEGVRDAVLGADGGAFFGLVLPQGAYDWQRCLSSFDMIVAPWGEAAMGKMTSLREARGIMGLVLEPTGSGGGGRAEGQWLAWQQAFLGIETGWLPRGLEGAWGSADGKSGTFREGVLDAAGTLKQGLGTLLIRANAPQAPIAVYASRMSEYVRDVDPILAEHTRNAEAAFIKLLACAGRQCRFIASDDVLGGALEEYPVLVLPSTAVMSDAEAAAIEAYVSNGGHIVADVVPGRFDTRGVASATSPLSGLFGVMHVGPAGWQQCTGVEFPLPGDDKRRLSSAALFADASLRIAGGVPLGEGAGGIPLWVRCSTGGGAALLMNHALTSGMAQAPEWAALLNGVLDAWEVQRLASVEAGDGKPLPGECFTRESGAAALTGFLAHPGAKGNLPKVRMELPKERFHYDLVEPGLRLRRDGVRLNPEPGEASLFASLPYEVTGVTLVAPEGANAGKRLPLKVIIEAGDATPGAHLVRVTLTQGTTKHLAHYDQFLECPHGERQTFIPLARNETPGLYRLEAHDLLTGMMASCTVEVKPGAGP